MTKPQQAALSIVSATAGREAADAQPGGQFVELTGIELAEDHEGPYLEWVTAAGARHAAIATAWNPLYELTGYSAHEATPMLQRIAETVAPMLPLTVLAESWELVDPPYRSEDFGAEAQALWAEHARHLTYDPDQLQDAWLYQARDMARAVVPRLLAYVEAGHMPMWRLTALPDAAALLAGLEPCPVELRRMARAAKQTLPGRRLDLLGRRLLNRITTKGGPCIAFRSEGKDGQPQTYLFQGRWRRIPQEDLRMLAASAFEPPPWVRRADDPPAPWPYTVPAAAGVRGWVETRPQLTVPAEAGGLYQRSTGCTLDTSRLVPLANGILDTATLGLYPHSPDLFAPDTLPVAWDHAAECPAWLEFLASSFEPEGVETLARFLGLALTRNMDYQRMLVVQGATGTGKGTMLRVAEALVGTHQYASSQLHKAGDSFGMEMVKRSTLLLAFPDIRISRRAHNVEAAVGSILELVGQDAMSTNRKHEKQVTERLDARVIMCANVPLPVPDGPGALLRRAVFVPTVRSPSAPDPTLSRRLLGELPGILRWAVAGLQRLRADGAWPEGPAAAEWRARQAAAFRGGDVESWLQRVLEPAGPHEFVTLPRLQAMWAEDQPGDGPLRPGDVLTAIPSAADHLTKDGRLPRRTIGDERVQLVVGVRLRVRDH
jgi:hypothetical protein